MVERSFSRIFEVELESDRLERECGLSLRGLEVNGLDQLKAFDRVTPFQVIQSS